MKRRRPRPPRSSTLNRAPVLVATGLAAVLALTGCQVMSPMQTAMPYQPADGVAVDLGDVQIRDLLIIAGAKGEVGVLSGMVVNKGKQAAVITFRAGSGGGAATREIPAGRQARLSGVEGTAPVTLPDISAAPGGMVRLTVGTPAGGNPEVSVPVMLPDGIYSGITPGPSQTTGP